MDDWTKKIRLFLEQQIELYGDEQVLSYETLQNLTPAQESVQEQDWTQSETLFVLNERIKTCVNCALGYSRRNFVFGNGTAHADIMLVGEAPGAEEDQEGFVFIGQAGQLLDKILKAIDLERREIYITNILKCHPPKNRNPLPNEVDACLPYLYKQIELIHPAFILCLGRFAAQSVLQTQSPLNQLRGKVHDFRGTSVIVTYHPAALLRYPEYKRPTWEDVKLLKRSYDEWLNKKSSK